MRRRLALGRLLLRIPSLILLDEPHAALDAEGQALVDRLLAAWHERGATVLVASHQSERIARQADGWARLDGGLLTDVGGEGVGAGESTIPAAGPLTTPVAADR
jgi:ABC-type multidrug transport system ATPase subunit